MNNLLELFDKKSLSKYPDPHSYEHVWQRSLWTLYVVSEEQKTDRMTATQIADFLTNFIGINTSYQAVKYAVDNMERGLVNIQKSGMKIMEKGRKAILTSSSPDVQIHIKNGNTLSSKNILCQEIVSILEGNICICDPYVSARIFDVLLKANKKSKIQIITANIEDKPAGIFLRSLQDMKKEGYDIEIKTYDKSELHDRYIIDQKAMWIIGHSIKDLGSKECFIVKVGEDLRESTLSVFNRRWSVSKSVTQN